MAFSLLEPPSSSSPPSEDSEERYAFDEFLLIVHCELRLRVNAVSKCGVFMPDLCITAPSGSLPTYMGFTVHGSDLHMIGGYAKEDDESGLLYSLDTFVLEVGKIPRALASADGLSQHLARGPRLNSLKIMPAVYIVKDCIYVLSNGIHGRNSPFIDFEFRKLGDRDWTSLPNPPVSAADVRSHPFAFAAGVESHALVGNESIVISLTNRMGAFVFHISHGSWSRLKGTVGFIGQPICTPKFSYAPSGSALHVFENGIWSHPVQVLQLKETPTNVSLYTTRQIAMVGDVTFIIQCGSPAIHPEFVSTRPVYIMMGRYTVSRAWDDEKGSCNHSITDLGDPSSLSLTEEVFEGSVTPPYCLPVSLLPSE